jgi:hypothetical protein
MARGCVTDRMGIGGMIGGGGIGEIDPNAPPIDPLATIRGYVYPGTDIGIGALRWGLQPLPSSLQTGGVGISSDGFGNPSTTMASGVTGAPGGSPGSAAASSLPSWAARSFVAHPWIWFFVVLLLVIWLFRRG